MLYIYKEGDFIRRGSPHGSSEAGAYAYTEVNSWILFFMPLNLMVNLEVICRETALLQLPLNFILTVMEKQSQRLLSMSLKIDEDSRWTSMNAYLSSH